MIYFEKVSSDLGDIEAIVQDNCKKTMTPFKGGNLKRRLEKIYREASKLKTPERTKVHADVKELKKSVRALCEAHQLLKTTKLKCDCKKCNPYNSPPRDGIRL